MKGRPREPIDLIIAKGKKHLTQEEIETRRSQELDVPFVDVKAPYFFNKKQTEEFNEVAKKLVSLGIFTELDEDCLTRYILSKELYLKYTSELTKVINKGDYDNAKKLQILQDKAFRQCQSSARDLGLTVTSRMKLVIPDNGDDDDDEL